MYADLLEKGRDAEALDALREAVRLNPDDIEARAACSRRAALAAGDLEGARGYLDRETAGRRSGAADGAAGDRAPVRRSSTARARSCRSFWRSTGRRRRQIVELAWTLLPDRSPTRRSSCIDAAVDARLRQPEFDGRRGDAAGVRHARAGSGSRAAEARRGLRGRRASKRRCTRRRRSSPTPTSAAGQGGEARVIAEDLVAREPWEHAHIDRFRRALVMLDVPDPDTVIAERLSGQDAVHGDRSSSRYAGSGNPQPDRAGPDRAIAPVAEPESAPTWQPSRRRKRGRAGSLASEPRSSRKSISRRSLGELEEAPTPARRASARRPRGRESRRGVQGFPQGVTRQGRPISRRST